MVGADRYRSKNLETAQPKSRVHSSRRTASILTILLAAALASMAHAQAAPAGASEFSGKVRLVLPKVIYAAVNVETNIYFDNVVLAPHSADYIFDVRCEKGSLLVDRWSFTPAANEKGRFPLTLEVRDDTNAVIARAESTLVVAAAEAGVAVPVTLLAIGDSLTQASIYSQHLLELADSADGPAMKLIGSRGPDNGPAHGSNRHEGYSGWTAQAFVTFAGPLSRSGYFKGRETGSPFVYMENGKPHLDFGKYCTEFNGGRAPDFVTIALGTNDIFYGTDENINSLIDNILGYFDSLIGMIHDFDRSTRIGVLLVIPPSSSQDGFRNYRGPQRQTRWQYRRDQHRMIERLIVRYGGREKENIYLVPAYLDIDTAHNFVTRPLAWNAENAEETERVLDGIHPAAAGYRQMADMIYVWLKTCLSDRSK
jgi:lysophospholipase L1-like esterase